MDRDVRMSVSQIFRGAKGDREIYVEFSGSGCKAEGKISFGNKPHSPNDAGKLPDFTPVKKQNNLSADPEAWNAFLLSSSGFSDEEIDSLLRYLRDNKESILKLAGGVDAMRSFLEM